MSYEKTVWAGEGTLAREQEYNYHWCYERGIITKAWLDIHAATGDRRFYDAAKANVDQYVTEDGAILTYEPEKYNLDMICMGRTALRLFKATGEAKYEKACRRLIEQIKGQPTTAEGGFWHKKLYPQQMWLDGIYMACPFLTEFAVTFGEMQWADLAAKQMELIFEKTRLESGLHAHAWDSAKAQKWADPQTGLSPARLGTRDGLVCDGACGRFGRSAGKPSGLRAAEPANEIAADGGDGRARRGQALASGDGQAGERRELCGILLFGHVHLRAGEGQGAGAVRREGRSCRAGKHGRALAEKRRHGGGRLPRTDAHLQGRGAGRGAVSPTAVMTTMYTKPCAAGTRRAPRPS